MIHADHPFADLPEDRDPVRRFRGRLEPRESLITGGDIINPSPRNEEGFGDNVIDSIRPPPTEAVTIQTPEKRFIDLDESDIASSHLPEPVAKSHLTPLLCPPTPNGQRNPLTIIHIRP